MPILAVVAALLTLSGTALAVPPEQPFAQARPGHSFVPAHEAVIGDAEINGWVLKYDGSPEAQERVWGSVGGADVGGVLTDDAGRFSFIGIPAAVSDGSLEVVCGAGRGVYRLDGLSWEAPGPTSFEIRPGAVDLEVVFGSQAESRNSIWTEVSTTDGDVSARTQNSTSSTEPFWAGPAYILPGTITSAALYYGPDRGTELGDLVGQTVTAGKTLPGPYYVDQSDTRRVWLGGWASGRPGSRARLWIENYPKGWVNSVAGTDGDWLATPVTRDYGNWASVGNKRDSRLLTIPAQAKPGFYHINVNHRDGPLTLRTGYQVCTLNASKSTIRKGSRVRLSGVVPRWSDGTDWSDDTGSSRKVIVYKRTTASGQPGRKGGFTRWNGWTRAGTYRANDLGRYSTRLLRPSRTTWYVVWYPKDGEYRAAYTSVRKVTVK